MTGAEIMAVALFILSVIGAVAGFWWRVESKVKGAEDKADMAMTKISDLRIHVAEEYTTKAGLREVKDEIMDAIHGVKGAVDHLGGRIDSMYQGGPIRPRVTK